MPDLTHEVFNQPEPLVDYNLFESNRALRDALKLNAPRLDTAELSTLGATLGTRDMQTHARLANVHTPQLRSHDRYGRRIDEVEFHPSKVTYAELRSGTVELNGEEVRTSSLSSFRRARQVATELKGWVESGRMQLSLPTRPIDAKKLGRPMHQSTTSPKVLEIMDTQVFSIGEDEEITSAAKKLLKGETNHLPVINGKKVLVGIVTTFDISKAVANPGKAHLVKDIMKKKVVTTTPEEAVDIAVQKLEKYNISALPVVDAQLHVIGILTAMNLGKLFGGRWLK